MTEDAPTYKKLVGESYWVKIHDTEILALNLPTSKDKQAAANLSVQGAGGGYKSAQVGDWLVFGYREDIGLVPIDQFRVQVAQTLTIASGSTVRPQDITVSGAIVTAQDHLSEHSTVTVTDPKTGESTTGHSVQ